MFESVRTVLDFDLLGRSKCAPRIYFGKLVPRSSGPKVSEANAWKGVFVPSRLPLCSAAWGVGAPGSEPGGPVVERGAGAQLPEVPEQRGR